MSFPHFQPQTNSKAQAFTKAFLKNSTQQQSQHKVQSMLSHKAVILGYSRPKKDKSRRNTKRAKGLNARQKRAMKIFHIKPEHQRLVRNLHPDDTTRMYMTAAKCSCQNDCNHNTKQLFCCPCLFTVSIIIIVDTSCSCLCMNSGDNTLLTSAVD